MHQITPHLWFDKEAVEAAEFYCSTVPGSKVSNVSTIRDTPSGDADIVSFELAGQPFMAISAGPLFKFNPSVSFVIRCGSTDEVDSLWGAFSEGGKALMPLDAYPFSERFGWTEDRFGLSWQIMLDSEGSERQRIAPSLLFVGEVCGRAEEAMKTYTSLFPESKIGDVARWEKDEDPEEVDTIKHGTFFLNGQEFWAMDSARNHEFSFNEAISLMVRCDTQEEIDRYWHALSAVPESEQCGWLKDRFGLSWQIVPSGMEEWLSKGTEEQIARVTKAFLSMKKFDIAELERAATGTTA